MEQARKRDEEDRDRQQEEDNGSQVSELERLDDEVDGIGIEDL